MKERYCRDLSHNTSRALPSREGNGTVTNREGALMPATGERRASATDAAILELVRRRSETSRVDLARELGVPPATVTYAGKRLLAAELLREGRFAGARGGKRPALLGLDAQARGAIGGTAGAGRLSLVGADLSGALRSRIALRLPAPTDAAEVSAALDRALPMIDPQPDARS